MHFMHFGGIEIMGLMTIRLKDLKMHKNQESNVNDFNDYLRSLFRVGNYDGSIKPV